MYEYYSANIANLMNILQWLEIRKLIKEQQFQKITLQHDQGIIY